jgi:hypothetical protein
MYGMALGCGAKMSMVCFVGLVLEENSCNYYTVSNIEM